ncbi:hypothetical protein X975_00774, partial [Stegodyphus mimosarum]
MYVLRLRIRILLIVKMLGYVKQKGNMFIVLELLNRKGLHMMVEYSN